MPFWGWLNARAVMRLLNERTVCKRVYFFSWGGVFLFCTRWKITLGSGSRRNNVLFILDGEHTHCCSLSVSVQTARKSQSGRIWQHGTGELIKTTKEQMCNTVLALYIVLFAGGYFTCVVCSVLWTYILVFTHNWKHRWEQVLKQDCCLLMSIKKEGGLCVAF